MHVGRNNPQYEYKMNDILLGAADEEKNLGDVDLQIAETRRQYREKQC